MLKTMTNKDLIITEPKMTLKQKKFLKRYFELGNGVKAAMEVYDCNGDYSVAGAIASENLKKLKNPIRNFMEAKGLDLGKLMTVLEKGLDCTRIKTSLTEPDKEVPDWPTRHKYMETAGRWLGVEPTNSENTEGLKRKLTIEEWFKEEA